MWINILLIIVAFHLYDWWKRYLWVSNLNKKCVFITGCDSGFGNRTAKRLCDRGVQVFAGCYTEEGARKLREETGDRVYTVILDVSSTASIQAAYQYVKDNLPHGTELWGVVNNAGVAGNSGPIEFMTRDDYRSVMEVNCFGPMEVVRIFLPLLKKSKGRIVNTASMVSEIALPGTYPYTTSKFALRSFTEALRYEKAMWGIHVAVVEPGIFNTNILNLDDFKARAAKQWEDLEPEIREEYGQEYMQKTISVMSAALPAIAQTDLTPVVKAYEHALFSRKPYHKYTAGFDSKLFLFLKNYCPSFLLDKLILMSFAGVVPKALKEDQ